MFTAEFNGINTFLVGMSDILLTSSVERITRGQKCFELPAPVIIKITNPLARLVTIPERKWNHTLPYAESLWIATGRNDMNLAGHYVKNLYEFSDDRLFMRAGYGPRIRKYNGIAHDYTENSFFHTNSKMGQTHTVDQLKFVVSCFEKDMKTRQAIITIGDPAKDDFDISGNLKNTKDFPCTRSLHFMLNQDGNLDLIVHMRSNDFIWGASAVNIFNFTFMQEYVAAILNIPIGNYYHIVNNFHFYERHKLLVHKLADLKNITDDNYFLYDKTFSNLLEFDENLGQLSKYEDSLRNGNISQPHFTDDFFSDWSKLFFAFNRKNVKFKNPILNNLINQGNVK